MFEDMELRLLQYALEDAGGDVEKAANAVLSGTNRCGSVKAFDQTHSGVFTIVITVYDMKSCGLAMSHSLRN
jgi:hypothetical protein